MRVAPAEMQTKTCLTNLAGSIHLLSSISKLVDACLQEHKRVLIEADAEGLQFPMRALGRAAGLLVAPKPLVVRASGGRRGRFL